MSVAVLGAGTLELAQRLAGGPAQLGMVALALELREHHERAAPPRARRSGSSPAGRPAAPTCRARRSSGAVHSGDGGAERARWHSRRDGHGSPTRSGTSRKTTVQDRPARRVGRTLVGAAPWSGTGSGSGAGCGMRGPSNTRGIREWGMSGALVTRRSRRSDRRAQTATRMGRPRPSSDPSVSTTAVPAAQRRAVHAAAAASSTSSAAAPGRRAVE